MCGDIDKRYLGGIPIAWSIGRGGLSVETSSYAGGIKASMHGCDTARFLKSTLTELVSGNGNIDVETRIRNDN